MKTSFWERRKFFDAYGTRSNEQLAKLPPRGMRVTCPCCGYPTVLGGYEICRLCHWEDDGQDGIDASEIRDGPNAGYSLVAARQSFEMYLTMYPPEADRRIGGPDSERETQIKRAIIEAFDQMLNEPLPDELNRLWQVVAEGERALDQELKRRVWGPLYEVAPCPYCGKPLRTRLAKQCRECGTDWHDPDNPIKLPGF